jgi:hypothetical protein
MAFLLPLFEEAMHPSGLSLDKMPDLRRCNGNMLK